MTSPFERLRERVAADEALALALARIEEPAEFVVRLRALEPDLADANLAPALQPDPAGIARMAATVPNAATWPSRHWLPVQAGPIGVDWAHFAGAPLDEPLFGGSARRAMARPFNRLFRHVTGFRDFVAGAAAAEAHAPAGFVFHMSRCGSTLVAQMLGRLDGAVIVSEAAPLDAAVRSGSAEALHAMIAALGRRRSAEERFLVLKLDFAHAPALPLFRAAFPDVPWLFLYRDPIEVLVSHMALPSLQTVIGPGPETEESRAQAIAAVCEAAIGALETGGGMAIDYAELPGAMDRILAFFGVPRGAAEQAAMAPATTRHAKRPESEFAPDGAAKRAAATDAVRAAARRHLAGPFRRLEALRYSPTQ